MYKNFLAIILAINFVNSYSESSEKINLDQNPEKFALAKMKIAQQALESMDNQWTVSQMATVVTVASVVGMVISLGIGKDNPSLQNNVFTACSGLAVSSFGVLSWNSGAPAGDRQERYALVKTIQETQPRYRAV